MQAIKVFDAQFCSKTRDWLEEAGRCVLGGPWRLTEPCDVTIGGATWLDQAQETAARTNQNAGPHRRKAGQQRAAPISEGVGSTQDRRGNRQLQIHTGSGQDQKNCPRIAKMSTQVQRGREMQGEAWDCREEGLKQRRQP